MKSFELSEHQCSLFVKYVKHVNVVPVGCVMYKHVMSWLDHTNVTMWCYWKPIKCCMML